MHDPALPAYVPFATEPLGLMGSLRAARTNLLSILPELAVRQPMVSGRTGIRWHMVMEPGAIRRILLENVDNYPKSKATKNILRPAIGDSLFIAEDAHWRWQRRTAAPVFSHRNVQSLGPIMIAAAQRSADRIATSNGRAVDLMEEMVRTTFDVISDVTFSGEGSFDSDAVHRSIDAYIAAAGKVSILDMLGVPDWVPRPSRFTSGPVVAQMKQVADQAIVERRKRGASAVPDLLDMLLSGQDPETKRKMNTAELRDNLLTFIVAGHETTALTLAWSTYLCAFAPEVQDKARAEIADVTGGGPVKTEHVGDLSYLRMIVDEALRLYPPAGILSRTAKESDVLCGRDIHPGDTVMLPVYALHRHHDLWKNPNAFDPERFADRKAVDRYAYLPFGDGPRICIGASFAIQEAVLILATLLQRFRFDLVAGRPPEPVMILTLRPDTGVWLTATPV
ncbi:cytochrome P450 [Shimia thalassica]|uniref:cytochrome P450 n=1 Tax=Shimia thalassica TaxID=1715693 RepID=UPI000C06FBA5|nr:cytochrome P450 [Shimia thalassica]PHO05981.1 cytochrome P450 [Rhodobacteraceae bacterium 4F10]MBU2941395.1 cytochrome P450 [Shimia thalassica]MDO6484070.1 cytochrome P450 [Shimia thalassica]MDO6503120.1 cytochrome P450 [Shimia thalassica]MDP2518282.1 cytochrome P450 [Shimia thalassica]